MFLVVAPHLECHKLFRPTRKSADIYRASLMLIVSTEDAGNFQDHYEHYKLFNIFRSEEFCAGKREIASGY